MNEQNLKPYGSGKLTPEQELKQRRKGAENAVRSKKQKKTASELFSLALSSEIKDKDLQKLIDSFGMEGKTVDIALVASAIKNAMRKGTVSDALDAFSAAGRTENERDEEAHAAFLHALTADEPEENT